jgi:TldD protein
VKAARVSAARKLRQCTLAPSVATGAWTSPVREPVTDEAIEEIISFIREADTVVQDYPSIVSRQISFLSTIDEKEIATSEGTSITQREYRVFCTGAVTAKQSGRRATSNNAVGGQVGMEFLAKDDLETMVREECERAVRLSTAHMPPAGECSAVLSPEVASVLVHEAVGHTAEADVVSGGSYLSGKIGEKVATPCITLIDDGQYPHGFGTYGFDDEGVTSQKTHIIEKGFLNHYLHSRETAPPRDAPTGNARSWLYSREPLIRMTNTYLEPQTYTGEELIQEAKTGLLLKGVT